MAETDERKSAECSVCHRYFEPETMRNCASLASGITALIQGDIPGWRPEGWICRGDLTQYRARYLERLLGAERGALSELDREVIDSFATGAPITEYIEPAFEERRTLGEQASDAVASFGGSWNFIGLFALVLVVWMGVNVAGVLGGGFDPYPFILLNLVLSCIAAIQAPIIMMSQRRTESKDRLRAENDYKVNLKAELEIRRLHDKIDHHMARQWERLVEMQRIQIEMLEEAATDQRAARGASPEEG